MRPGRNGFRLPLFRLRRALVIQVDDLKQRLDIGDEVLILDVRGTSEYAGEHGHIPGARNIPVEELPRRMDELDKYRERPIVVVCRTDRRSTQAAQQLTHAGFADVHVVRGGMMEWSRAAFPLNRQGR